ncbi:MAG: hypothetical protein Q9227_000888 [Pyrenula ochraceoflavens]
MERNVLGHLERNANSHPQSAVHQEAFYDMLIASDMPKIVIERYNSGRYATSDRIESIYMKALRMTGALPASSNTNPLASPRSGRHDLSPETLQAVGQAVAAHSTGNNVSSVSGSVQSGSGAKDSPLHVVVNQTKGSVILSWVKTFIYAIIATYAILTILAMITDVMGGMRGPRIFQNSEVQAKTQTVRFSDVQGCDEAKDEVQELVEFLKNPDQFNTLGGKLPKGVLMVGPPGTGKTLLAKAVAGEAGVPFFYMSGSEFDELYVGVGAKRMRDLFAQARSKAPAIIFIDELDAVGGKRNPRDPSYAKQTLNQLLTELDGFNPSTGVVLIGATNAPDALDKALTRPGRFDRHIRVNLPDIRGRIAILKHHMRNIQVATDVDATVIARGTPGFSGAQLENLANQAAVHASRLKQKRVTTSDLEWARDKIMMGAENRSMALDEQEKILTAYHESGHALVSMCNPDSIPLHKMTIIPRGFALGVTHSLPEKDMFSQRYDGLIARLEMAMGGRAAEDLVFGPGKVTSGCSNDIQNATQIAYAMVTEMGFSKKFPGMDMASNYNSMSSETKMEVEKEVQEILHTAYERAQKLLRENRGVLEKLKDAVLEYETLTREEMETIRSGGTLEKLKSEKEKLGKSDDGDGRKGVAIKLPEVLLPEKK